MEQGAAKAQTLEEMNIQTGQVLGNSQIQFQDLVGNAGNLPSDIQQLVEIAAGEPTQVIGINAISGNVGGHRVLVIPAPSNENCQLP